MDFDRKRFLTVRYVVEFEPEDRPSVLPAATRAVDASAYEWWDIGQGGITREEVRDDDVQEVGVFPAGSELFVESPLASDCLDDTDGDTAVQTRIWWRIELVEDGAVKPAANTSRYTLDGRAVDLAKFLTDNSETFTSTEIEAARGLQVGEEITYGGGGWALSTLRRVE